MTQRDTRQILTERKKTHGEYSFQSSIIEKTLKAWQQSAGSGWDSLSPWHKETLHMLAHKVGRILVGDPNVRDHWDDIAGYATLSADRCTSGIGPGTPEDGGHHARQVDD